MKKSVIAVLFFFLLSPFAWSQYKSQLSEDEWVDSVLVSLTEDQRIAQLMVIRAHSNLGESHINQVTELIEKYNVGGLVFFQGGPVRQANLTNYYQSLAKTPLLICIDGEWGLGMRLDSVINFPRQLMAGAVNDAAIVYEFGKAVGEQCKRLGIHVNFAPVVDVNNNPANPVINDRSFGEDKYKVALFGVQYMKGMQDVGVLACAKHFPGHGDVTADSHYDLPVINKTVEQLDSLELFPFREIFKAGVGSVMIAHLYIPAIDNTANLATSLSYNNVTKLLRDEMDYQGISFTDALEMEAVAKYFPKGEVSARSLIAGNDILCLPGDIEGSILEIKKAIRRRDLTWPEIDARVRKVLRAKYRAGLNEFTLISTENIVADLNKYTNGIRQMIADHAITLLSNNDGVLPLMKNEDSKIAYVGVGLSEDNFFSGKMKSLFNADIYFFNYKQDLSRVNSLIQSLQKTYTEVIVGVHQYSRRPASNFGLSASAVQLVNTLSKQMRTTVLLFGNPYAAANFCDLSNLLVCYEDDEITQQTAIEILSGSKTPRGVLPVTVCEKFQYGTGLIVNQGLVEEQTHESSLNPDKIAEIESLLDEVTLEGAAPGGVVLVAKDGKIVYEKAFGVIDVESGEPVTTDVIYDLASVTKISATTLSIMKLYEEGKIDLKKKLVDYLPWVKGTNKANLVIEDLLMHQAGLKAWIPFYKETIDPQTQQPIGAYYSNIEEEDFTVRVTDQLYMRKDWVDTIYKRILSSELENRGKYVYSDLDFIFLGRIVEEISGMSLAEYVNVHFYEPLGMTSTCFLPYKHFPLNKIAPTENEPHFRMQLIRGDVHDPAAAMLGGIAGHAGLFSNAADLAKLYQMLLNGGEMKGRRYLNKETIDLFTSYGSRNSRRGLGFDKPEKDNNIRKDPYPTLSASPFTYGHTGFTGTCVWVDPAKQLIFIFLSNRVHPDGTNRKMIQMNVRGRIHELVYQALTN